MSKRFLGCVMLWSALACGTQPRPVNPAEFTAVHRAAIESATQYVVCGTHVDLLPTATYVWTECVRESQRPVVFWSDGDVIGELGDATCRESRERRHELPEGIQAFEVHGCDAPITIICGVCGVADSCASFEERSRIDRG